MFYAQTTPDDDYNVVETCGELYNKHLVVSFVFIILNSETAVFRTNFNKWEFIIRF